MSRRGVSTSRAAEGRAPTGNALAAFLVLLAVLPAASAAEPLSLLARQATLVTWAMARCEAPGEASVLRSGPGRTGASARPVRPAAAGEQPVRRGWWSVASSGPAPPGRG